MHEKQKFFKTTNLTTKGQKHKTTMKKAIIFLLLITTFVLVLTSCNANSNDTKEPSTEQSNTQEITESVTSTETMTETVTEAEAETETKNESTTETITETETMTEPESIKNSYTQISGAEAYSIMQNESDYMIIDARTEEEFAQGHIKDAILIPEYEVAQKAPSLLSDKEQLILVYCRSGRRSKIAAEALAELGYTNVKEFGGIINWEYETVK